MEEMRVEREVMRGVAKTDMADDELNLFKEERR
jgi:hypothetical protein